jgi:FAD-linked sulfhydryl oxidase
VAADGPPPPPPPHADCPPDADQIGRSTWTLLHTMATQYPERPTHGQQAEVVGFVGALGNLYPCGSCATDFRSWMGAGNRPRVSSREDFGQWLCEAHNAVNSKLGKPVFDCSRWEERWRDGWKDGSCD